MGCVAAAYNFWEIGILSNGSSGGFSKRSNARESRHKRQDFLPEFFAEVNGVFNNTVNYSVPEIANPSTPNPFGGSENITFADNAEVGQGIPFWPLIQPERKLDFM